MKGGANRGRNNITEEGKKRRDTKMDGRRGSRTRGRTKK